MNTDFLSKWLVSGALFRISGDRLLLAAGELERTTEPSTLYAPDFFLTDPRPWIRYEKQIWLRPDELLAELERYPEKELPPLIWTAASRPAFHKTFQGLQERIRSGELTKGVPYIQEQAEGRMEGQRLLQAIRHLLRYAQRLPVYPYGFWNPREGILGCTPELLFQQDPHGDIQTMALAGTRRDEDVHLPPLLDDPKERREHQWVIDSIVADLGRFGRSKVHPTEVARLPLLSHLKTRIELHPSNDVAYEELVRALHPTPALGAYPRERGWKWLMEMDESSLSKRGRFGAPFGASWKNADGSGEALCAVAIRGLQWQSRRVLISAGCGVIAESEEEREWQELEGKIRAIRWIFGA